MKQAAYILSIPFLLTACYQTDSKINSKEADTTTIIADTLREIDNDSLILYNDSLFNNLDLSFTEISKAEFQSYQRAYKTKCISDSGQFISGSDLYVSHDCNEICETYLVEKKTNRKMLMPSSYDAGVLKMLLSPSCNQLIICSSYDGPDYENYYDNRAEIFVFNITTEIGLKGIKPAFEYFTKNWSINNLTWVDENTIALELYNETQTDTGEEFKLRYFKTRLNSK